MRLESILFALSSSALRVALKPWPARLIKNVSIRIPDPGPLGEIRLEARVRAIVLALLLKRPSGGYVESVVTVDIQRFLIFFGMTAPFATSIELPFALDAYGGYLARWQRAQDPRLDVSVGNNDFREYTHRILAKEESLDSSNTVGGVFHGYL